MYRYVKEAIDGCLVDVQLAAIFTKLKTRLPAFEFLTKFKAKSASSAYNYIEPSSLLLCANDDDDDG